MATVDDPSESPASASWRDKSVLERLYNDLGMSLRQIGDELGCHWTTIHKWATDFGIELRPANDEKLHPSASTNPEGYTYYSSRVGDERDRVGQHQLVAVLSGADPEEVFSPETQVHHRRRVPGSLEIAQLDLPGNLEVIDAYEHLSRLSSDAHDEPTIEHILDDNRVQ